MYLLDTDTLTHLYAGNARVAERFKTVGDPDTGTTIVTKAEMLRGRIDYILKATTGTELLRAQNLFSETEALLSQILVVPFNQAAAEQFEQLVALRNLRKIGRADLLIASITLANQAILVTRNIRHFRQFPGLRIENWVD
ncbi:MULTISPECIES: PIN domain-containing protein [Leptolyngbya]|uniref:PIN domain-containing protein n=1 Tax=Leptolyngbya TaxID=47251 RepID=UPI001684FB99|nr:PIN domain-containing protein [Leptolyngbya sp. FACHB-1624]MBD1854699.1 type II toxin-antitoxin system VapC family toxin [Leptolyngbya sp. FACHB-1624]